MKEGKLGTHLHGESEHWRPDHHTLNQPSTGRAGIPFSCHPEAARPEGEEKDPREGSIPVTLCRPRGSLGGGRTERYTQGRADSSHPLRDSEWTHATSL